MEPDGTGSAAVVNGSTGSSEADIDLDAEVAEAAPGLPDAEASARVGDTRFRSVADSDKDGGLIGQCQRSNSGNYIFVPDRPCIGIDMGGTMCKICYLEKKETPADTDLEVEFRNKLRVVIASREAYGETGVRDTHLEFDSELLGGHVYLAQFETRKMVKFIEMIKDNKIADATTAVNGTGGGAKKYSKRVKEVLDISMQHCDELQCLISGINFMVQRDADVLYTVDHTSYKIDGLRLKPQGSSFPYLLVNIGSGVSILRINEDGSHERVGGTSLGGSTFFGLCCVVTGCSTFAESMAFAEKGNARNIDLLVEDIYGGDYDEYDLSGDTVASSLGKLVHPEVRAKAASEDVARAILDAITNNIGSLALLHARAHGIQRVIFAGNFLRGNKISIARLAYAMEFWSKGYSHATFLKHEGYMGSIGAMLMQNCTVPISHRSTTPVNGTPDRTPDRLHERAARPRTASQSSQTGIS